MITDRQAKSIKPGDKNKPTGVTGLTLRPTNTKGRGQWHFRYVSPITSKRRETSFGTYPDVSVANALEAGRKARQILSSGLDVIDTLNAEKEMASTIPTFEEAARARFAELHPSFKKSRHDTNWIRSLELHAFKHIGHIKVDELKPKDFADMLSPIWLDIKETAARIKQRCHNVMAFCYAQGFVNSNPVDVVHMLLPAQNAVVQHQPSMPWKLVPEFVRENLYDEIIIGAKAALLFTILTAARSGEAREATWSEFDLEERLWIIPAERMKASKEHRVPLSLQAVELIEMQKIVGEKVPKNTDVVFKSVRGKTLSDAAMTMLLRRAKAQSDIAGRVATAHGFRSSFRNWAADNDYSSDIAERALAHIIANRVQAAYERTDRLEARVKMMQDWADHVFSEIEANSRKTVDGSTKAKALDAGLFNALDNLSKK